MVDINKIRNNELTEDEKMELIADYLEQGGGGGGSDKLRVKVKVDYVPTSASEIITDGVADGSGYYMAPAGYVSFQDSEGNPIDNSIVEENVINGTIEISDMDHAFATVVINGDQVEVEPAFMRVSSVATSTIYNPGAALMAAGTIGMGAAGAGVPIAIGLEGGEAFAIVPVTVIIGS